MNKNMIIIGAVAAGSFLALTAFQGKKTLDQQRAEIAAQIEVKLGEIRIQKEMECNDRVMAEATRRYDEMMANAVTTPAPTPGRANTARPKGPRVDPLPQKPPVQQSESKSKWGDGKTQESQSKWSKPAGEDNKNAPAQPQESKSKWGKPAGGGN